MRKDNNIVAAFKMVDTCAAEFAAETPYYYSCFGSENEAAYTSGRKKVLVLGSGPIRIGQGIEFDFCSVHSTWAFSKEGYETIIVNNNPETVSTDFDIADKLYFEPLTPEDVESIVDIEKPDGAVVQFGGQTAIKLTESLMKMGVTIFGTAAEDVDAAEDRELFDKILEECSIPRPAGHTVYTAEEAKEAAHKLGYPVLVRPSYVLGGQGMQIAISDQDVDEFIGIINQIAQEGAIQIFQEFNTGLEEIIVGVVGVLQFDVLKYRLENEYNVEIRLENLPYEHIRWIENKDEIDLAKLSGTSDMKKVKDMKGNPLLLFVNSWSIGMTLDRNKGLVLTEFGRN